MPSDHSSAFYSRPEPIPQPLQPSSNNPRINNSTNTNQACAACKYQRRKCTPDCLLAPYFPHDLHWQFLNAHKLFGVSNITKIIKTLSPSEKDATMHSIIFQSDARAKDPVGGCYRIIRELQYQLEYTRNELDLVLQHLAAYRERTHQKSRMQMQEPEEISSFSSSCDLDLNNSMTFNYPLHVIEQQQQYCSSGNFTDLQQDMWCLQLQDSSISVNMKPDFIDECVDMKQIEEVSNEKHIHVESEHESFVERNLNMASAQLIISSS